MKTKGIRIYDHVDDIVNVRLKDILNQIENGIEFYWAILFLIGIGDLGQDKSIPLFQTQIREAEKGLFITWSELNILSNKFEQIIDITIIGCKNKNLLTRYQDDQVMYETCDIVIEMIDSSYWEVFSKNETLIQRLADKFKNTIFLMSDFEK